MARSTLATERIIQESARRFYSRTDRRVTRARAIQIIKTRLDRVWLPACAYWCKADIQQRTYLRFAAREMIDRLCDDPEPDPVITIYRLYVRFADIAAISNRRLTLQFAWTMMEAINDMLDLLE